MDGTPLWGSGAVVPRPLRLALWPLTPTLLLTARAGHRLESHRRRRPYQPLTPLNPASGALMRLLAELDGTFQLARPTVLLTTPPIITTITKTAASENIYK